MTTGLSAGNLDLAHVSGNAARSAFGDTLGGGQWVFEGTLLVTGTAAIGWSALNVAMNNFPTQGPVVVYPDNGNKYVSSTSGTGPTTLKDYFPSVRIDSPRLGASILFSTQATAQQMLLLELAFSLILSGLRTEPELHHIHFMMLLEVFRNKLSQTLLLPKQLRLQA
jgi:hypothetical protein